VAAPVSGLMPAVTATPGAPAPLPFGSPVPEGAIICVGISVGGSVGTAVGVSEGAAVGFNVGVSVGFDVGASVGSAVGGVQLSDPAVR